MFPKAAAVQAAIEPGELGAMRTVTVRAGASVSVLLTTDRARKAEDLAQLAQLEPQPLLRQRDLRPAGHTAVLMTQPGGYSFVLITPGRGGTWDPPSYLDLVLYVQEGMAFMEFPPDLQACVERGLALLPTIPPSPLSSPSPSPAPSLFMDLLLSPSPEQSPPVSSAETVHASLGALQAMSYLDAVGF